MGSSVREWQDYLNPDYPNTVAGSLRLLPIIHSPQLDNVRSILVHLPPSYHTDADRHYPVIYMHDGQNLFDQHLAFSDEWQVDETLLQLAEEGLEAIVVGIPTNDERLHEYSPFVDENYGGGKGLAYLEFISHTIKPIIDEDFRTQPQRSTTGILGSSMGGLISLYGFLHSAQVFGFVGAFSPAIWFADKALFAEFESLAQLPEGKIYLDMGHQEVSEHPEARQKSEQYTQLVRQFRDSLVAKGYSEGDNLMYREDEAGTHKEQAWARRLPDALRFLINP
ncbi:MAG: alpha/beta hydrolase [Anaerolineae bacterium]|nr:alpha/beta hydrolase [Anaerolineae bacterium]